MAAVSTGAGPQLLEDQMLEDVPLKSLRHLTVNLSFLRRAWRILKLGLRSPCAAPRLWLLIIFDVGFQICGAYIIQSHLYIIATGRDNSYPGLSGCLRSGCNGKPAPGESGQVVHYIGQFAWAFCVSMTFVLLMSYAGDLINTAMRMNCGGELQRRALLGNKLLYRLTVDGTMDNIDQRITSDLQVVLDGFTCVLFGNSADYLAYPVVFMIGRFCFALNNCFGLPELRDETRRWQIIAILLVPIVVSFVAYILPINHVSKLFYRGQRYEGDFRTTHTRAVLNAEQISMMRGESAELSLAQQQFMRVDANNRVYYIWQGVLLILRLFVNIAIPSFSYLCLAVTETVNSTTANFFQKQVGDVLEYSLYVPVLVERLAYACGATHRVGQLLEQIDRFEASPLATNVEHDPDRVELRGVHGNPPVPTPTDAKAKAGGGATFGEAAGGGRRSLFEGVSMVVKHGEAICIIGPSGCGKSSLLRVIAGLWGVDQGVVVKPKEVGRQGLFFLPQRPYVFPGTLQDMVEYPEKGSSDPARRQQAKAVLKAVYLQHLVDKYGMEAPMNWAAVLSISEMQRLNFARMFFHEPKFCLADECTSALDLRVESSLYQSCRARGISMISIAHRPSVIPHHEYIFQYEPKTHGWSQISTRSIHTEPKVSVEGLEEPPAQAAIEEGDDEEREEGLTCRFWRRLFRVLRFGFKRCTSQAWALFGIMVLCMGVYAGLTIEIFRDYGTSKIIAQVVGSKPYTRDVPQAMRDSLTILGLNVVVSVVQALSCFLGAIIAVKIQRGIIRHFHNNYFAPGVVYHMNRMMKERGIDQRMVQDLSGLREAIAWLLGNPFAYCNYRVGLVPLSFVWIILMSYGFSQGWQLTLFLLVFMFIAFIWQILSSFFTSLAVGRRQRCEGELRLHLGRVLQNVESITFFGGQEQELGVAEDLLARVVWARYRYVSFAMATSIPTITIYYWLQTGIYVMSAILAQWWAPGNPAVSPTNLFTSINFNIIWSKVTQLIIMCLGGFGMVIGFTHRVVHVVEKAQEAHQEVDEMQQKLRLRDSGVAFEQVSVEVPSRDGRRMGGTLIEGLTMEMQDSVCGSGHGKSSVMRVLAGMWPAARGTVSRPAWGRDGIFFVPQANYAVQGTLAAQVVYPRLVSEARPSAPELSAILEEVGLGYLVQRWGLHRIVNWDVVLSGGECQRLGFARVLFHRPRIAALDETTSALDLATEERCMNALRHRQIKLLSFAARPSVAAYHDRQLHLAPGGKWALSPVQGRGPSGHRDATA